MLVLLVVAVLSLPLIPSTVTKAEVLVTIAMEMPVMEQLKMFPLEVRKKRGELCPTQLS